MPTDFQRGYAESDRPENALLDRSSEYRYGYAVAIIVDTLRNYGTSEAPKHTPSVRQHLTLRDVADMERGGMFTGKPVGTHHVQTFTRVKNTTRGAVVSEFGHYFWLSELQVDSLERVL
jgi:hypothetical protein